jgi:hypothetical protein
MTTQTDITNSSQVVQAPLKIKTPIWPFIFVALLIVSVISAAILVIPPMVGKISGNDTALNAMSARYQGLAELHAAMDRSVTQRSFEAMSARYQGLADFHAASNAPGPG